jgi:hypothetical protein
VTVQIVQGDARKLDGVADGSVAAIVTSPGYFGQRLYEDDGKPIAGQIGAEPHPQEYLENLWACCKEWWRVLDDRGSLFVNLGDKRAASGAPGTTSGLGSKPQGKRTGIDSGYSRSHFGRPKSRQMIPERFAIGCEDGLADPEGIGWIVRQTFLDGVVPLTWEKANGLPESVTDRTRDNWEVIYHLTKSERYYSAVDELREPQQAPDDQRWQRSAGSKYRETGQTCDIKSPPNPLGRLPGSVWRIATEPLTIPDWAKTKYNLPSHFAAFPSEIPRRLILGWSPSAICLTCGEGRWPVVHSDLGVKERQVPRYIEGPAGTARHGAQGTTLGSRGPSATILGYACACTPTHIETETTLTHESKECDGTILVPTGVVDIWGDDRLEERPCTDPAHMTETTKHVTIYDLAGWTPPPDRPALILDPFCGTGTTALVAQALGRDALGVDLSADYVRLAKWRCSQPSQAAKAKARTWGEAQGSLAL